MCIRDRDEEEQGLIGSDYYATQAANAGDSILGVINMDMICLLYTSDAADERSSVDLGGRRIIKKKKSDDLVRGGRDRQ